MLLSDSDLLTPQELASYDPEVQMLNIPGTPLLTGPHSIIRSTAEDACHHIQSQFQTFSGYLMAPGQNSNAIAAVMNVFSTSVARGRMRMNQVVIEQPDPTVGLVKSWLKYSALYRFFRAVTHRKMDDRFKMKRDDYMMDMRRAWERIEKTGLPVVLSPLEAPGAIRGYRAGIWSEDNLSVGGSGSHETGGTYAVAISYVGQAYQSWSNTANSESALSSTSDGVQSAAAPTAGELITVNIANLNPPTSFLAQTGTADTIYSPMPATGWNVYAGPPGTLLMLQNTDGPIPIATKTWTFPDTPVINNFYSGAGQPPDYNFAFERVFSRA